MIDSLLLQLSNDVCLDLRVVIYKLVEPRLFNKLSGFDSVLKVGIFMPFTAS